MNQKKEDKSTNKAMGGGGGGAIIFQVAVSRALYDAVVCAISAPNLELFKVRDEFPSFQFFSALALGRVQRKWHAKTFRYINRTENFKLESS